MAVMHRASTDRCVSQCRTDMSSMAASFHLDMFAYKINGCFVCVSLFLKRYSL